VVSGYSSLVVAMAPRQRWQRQHPDQQVDLVDSVLLMTWVHMADFSTPQANMYHYCCIMCQHSTFGQHVWTVVWRHTYSRRQLLHSITRAAVRECHAALPVQESVFLTIAVAVLLDL
jgi:hypothetical protein